MKLMERVKATMRVKRYSLRTEKTYCYRIRSTLGSIAYGTLPP